MFLDGADPEMALGAGRGAFFRTMMYEENVPEELLAAMLAFPTVRF